MSAMGEIYRAEIMRAAFGSYRHEGKIDNPHRLTQLAELLAEGERAQEILRAKGYGSSGMSLVEIASSLPDQPRRIIDRIFVKREPRPDGLRYAPEEIARYFANMPDDPVPDLK